MYIFHCVCGMVGSLIVAAAYVATMWVGLRTVVQGLAAGDQVMVCAAVTAVAGVVLLIYSWIAIMRRDRIYATFIYDVDARRWVPTTREPLS